MENTARQLGTEKGSDQLSASPTVAFDDVEPWQRVNHFIRKYYRRSCGYLQALASMFQLHNESANIWTHILACTYFGLQQWWHPYRSSANGGISYSLDVFRTGGALCFGISALFHTFLCVSEGARKVLNKLDYIGIVLFLMAGGFAWLTITLYDRLIWRVIYSCCGFLFALRLGNQILFNDDFRSSEYQIRRAIEYGFFACLISVPFAHSCFLKHNYALFDGSLSWILISFAGGLFSYTSRWPECWWPGQWDRFPSHAFFHVCVFWGSRLYYLKLCRMVERF